MGGWFCTHETFQAHKVSSSKVVTREERVKYRTNRHTVDQPESSCLWIKPTQNIWLGMQKEQTDVQWTCLTLLHTAWWVLTSHFTISSHSWFINLKHDFINIYHFTIRKMKNIVWLDKNCIIHLLLYLYGLISKPNRTQMVNICHLPCLEL